MRKLAIAVALASTAMATPALARDHSFYAGVEGGVLYVENADHDVIDETGDVLGLGAGATLTDAVTLSHHSGFDVDLIAGYDFGFVRLEGELGYKRASINQAIIDPRIAGGGPGDNYDASGRGRAMSAMVNFLLDFGNEDGLSGYAGPGIGLAEVKYNPFADTPNGTVGFSDSDSGIAWQAIAGIRYAVSPNIDVGLKYRFFNVPNLHFSDSESGLRLDTRWRSHSIMASLIYNFWAPPPPPPPPATQTCPDGSVILATDTCPAPPPPPPPPPPAPERG